MYNIYIMQSGQRGVELGHVYAGPSRWDCEKYIKSRGFNRRQCVISVLSLSDAVKKYGAF